MSVFVQKPQAVGPKLPGGEEVDMPTFAKGEEFEQPPDKKTKFPGTPKFNTLKIWPSNCRGPRTSSSRGTSPTACGG